MTRGSRCTTRAYSARHSTPVAAPQALADALRASRADTLAAFAVYERALPGLGAAARQSTRRCGSWGTSAGSRNTGSRATRSSSSGRARADAARARRRAGADALYNSSRVAHDSRWQLPLPDAAATRADLARQLDATLARLREAGGDDDALYFFRLALLHEDMHHEAALYMARALDIPVDDARWRAPPLPDPGAALAFDALTWRLGSEPGAGFAFDNELPGCTVALPAFEIDAQALRWADYLPFVEAGGCDDARWWSDAGWRWRSAQPAGVPLYLRRAGAGWEQRRGGRWRALDLREAACHLTQHEAQAWCRWAGRRLPTEAEWECAACTAPEAFRWGDVWEWTASAFAPYPGFEPHPYRDYSAPWFDGRPVLKGASHCTQPRMRHPRYRNYFPAARADVPAGFRSCAL